MGKQMSYECDGRRGDLAGRKQRAALDDPAEGPAATLAPVNSKA